MDNGKFQSRNKRRDKTKMNKDRISESGNENDIKPIVLNIKKTSFQINGDTSSPEEDVSLNSKFLNGNKNFSQTNLDGGDNFSAKMKQR